MQKQYKLTQERFDEIKKELEYMKTVREREIADQIKEARSFGDLSENSEYDEAKNEQGKLYSRMAELESIIAHADIIAEEQLSTKEVTTGTKIIVEALPSKKKEEYFIVGSQEANPKEKRISDESPFGKSVLGAHVGDTVSVEAPFGTMKYKVLEISK